MQSKHRYLTNVTTLALNDDKCVGCGICEAVCPHGVFEMSEGKALLVDRDSCMECGACALNCPVDALAVESGVGCAAAFIYGWLAGGEPSISDNKKCC